MGWTNGLDQLVGQMGWTNGLTNGLINGLANGLVDQWIAVNFVVYPYRKSLNLPGSAFQRSNFAAFVKLKIHVFKNRQKSILLAVFVFPWCF